MFCRRVLLPSQELMCCLRPVKVLLFALLCCLTSTSSPGATRDVSVFGAVGNGKTDATAAINHAIAALRPGDRLYFPCGTYLITAELTIHTSALTIGGPANDCATLKLSGTADIVGLRVAGGGLSGRRKLVSDVTDNTFTAEKGALVELKIAPGDYVLVSDVAVQSNGPNSPLIADQQLVKVASTRGDTATIENSFSWLFTVAAGTYIQKLTPISGVIISHLSIDGSGNSGASSRGLDLNFAVQSEIGYVNVSNLMGTQASGGIRLDTGYDNHVHDVTCTKCGNGGSGRGEDSIGFQRQTLAAIESVNVVNTNEQKAFSFGLREFHYSTLSKINIDAGSADGRPFKLQRASHNTINGATVKNGGGNHNGISITDISQYNTFNDCVVLNNTGAGISMFGNQNIHNTFNNCTVKYNTNSQLGQSWTWDHQFQDHYTTINGGVYCCARGPHAILQINSDHFSMSNATVYDDNGMAPFGLALAGKDAVVTNNRFSGLARGRDVYVTPQTRGTFSSNSIPDGTTPAEFASHLR